MLLGQTLNCDCDKDCRRPISVIKTVQCSLGSVEADKDVDLVSGTWGLLASVQVVFRAN